MPYQIDDWAKYFESAKSKGIRRPTHAYMPNKQHGMGFLCLLREGPVQGLAVFGAWVATVQALSQQENTVRNGWLTDDGTPKGRPWTADDLAHRFRADPKVCQRMLDVCTSQGWMKYHAADTPVSAPGTPQGPPDNDLTGKDQKQTSPRRKNKASTGEAERANGDGSSRLQDSGSRAQGTANNNGERPGGERGEKLQAGNASTVAKSANQAEMHRHSGTPLRADQPRNGKIQVARVRPSPERSPGTIPDEGRAGEGAEIYVAGLRARLAEGHGGVGAGGGGSAAGQAAPVPAVERDGGREADPAEPEAGGLPERAGPGLPPDAEPDGGTDAAGGAAAPAGPEAETVPGGEAGVHEPDAGGGAREHRAAPGGGGAERDYAVRWLILAKALRTVYWDRKHQRYWPDTFLNWARVHHPEPSEERTLADIAAVARTEARKLNRSHRIDNVPAYAVALARNWTPGAFPGEDMARARLVFEELEKQIVAQGEAPEGLEHFTMGNGGGDHAEARPAAVAE